MAVAQPALEPLEPPFGAVVARQLSVWPFAARIQRLFLLVDPSLPEASLRHGLLRAMQQAYFRSDTASQTRSVREAALAAHYVLRHRNRDVLPLDQITAATAVAAVRGDLAFVALAGDAAAFAWHDGVLSGQHGIMRLPRPLGLEADPRITLWSTPLHPGDRLVLVCAAAWTADSQAAIEQVLVRTASVEVAEDQLAEALGGSRPAGVLIVEPAGEAHPKRHLTLVPPPDRARYAPPVRPVAPPPRPASLRSRWVSPLIALALLAAAVTAALTPSTEPPRLVLIHQAQALLSQANETVDIFEAHALTQQALDMATRAASQSPGEYNDFVAHISQKLDEIDRITPITPSMAVRLGPSGRNVVDLAIGDDALYTLDVIESTVRTFALDARDQQPTPDTLLVRAGAPMGPGSRRLATPVAIQYVGGARADQGFLTIVDDSRTVVQVGHDRALTPRPLQTSASWRGLGALGASNDGHFYVLDSGAHRLLEYPLQSQRVVDPPRVVLDDAQAPGLAFDRAVEIVGQQEFVYVRTDEGTLRRFDIQGNELPTQVRPPDGRPPVLSGIAPDRAGGLFLADPAHSRILHTTADGSVLRQLRDPALAGVRQIKTSLNGRRIYGLVTSGVMVFDVPADAQ
jgi:hypothetical protein